MIATQCALSLQFYVILRRNFLHGHGDVEIGNLSCALQLGALLRKQAEKGPA